MNLILSVLLLTISNPSEILSPREYIVGFVQKKESEDGRIYYRMNSGGARLIAEFNSASSVVPCQDYVDKWGHDRQACAITFDKDGLVTSEIDDDFATDPDYQDAGWGSVGISKDQMIVRFRGDTSKEIRKLVKPDSESIQCKDLFGRSGFKGPKLYKFNLCKMTFSK